MTRKEISQKIKQLTTITDRKELLHQLAELTRAVSAMDVDDLSLDTRKTEFVAGQEAGKRAIRLNRDFSSEARMQQVNDIAAASRART